MNNMPNMLAYTIRCSDYSNIPPGLTVGQGSSRVGITPTNPVDDSYWFVFLDRNNPQTKVKDFVIPGQNNTAVPAGVDAYMSNPQYIFALATQFLSLLHIPQGDFFDYLMKYGAGRQLQRIEQLNSTLGCGSIGRPTYVLTGQCGPRGGNNVSPPSYELGSITAVQYLTMSLMPMPDGRPPYGICDSLTYITR
jgi:hypothetical protein